MWVKKLILKNFRGFAELELDLDRPLTVIVGINGSGKSSLLRAIGATAGGEPPRYVGTYALPYVLLDARDLRVGASSGEVTALLRCDNKDIKSSIGWVQGAHAFKFLANGHYQSSNRPFTFFVRTNRYIENANVRVPQRVAPPHVTPYGVQVEYAAEAIAEAERLFEDEGVVALQPGYARFLEWFKEREDAENAQRVQSRDFDLQDPQLRAVREAVAELIQGFKNLRISRESSTPAMVVTKGEVELRLDQLSDGERNLIALAGELARRMVIANPASAYPRDTEGIILIDEIEQHLHPGWQREVIPALQRAFPKAQFIVTTHSPQVLSSVPTGSIVLLSELPSETPARQITAATWGRDTNAILREVFGVPDRPKPQLEEIAAIRALIDEDKLDKARERLDALAAKLTEADEQVTRLRMRFHLAATADVTAE